MAKKTTKKSAAPADDPLVAKLVDEIGLFEKDALSFRTKGDKIVKRYKDERETTSKQKRFNILWANVQTLWPALYAKNPKANVDRRFQDEDDVGRYASMALERAISYFIDDKYYDCMREAVLDRLLPGRGTVWIRYKPLIRPAAVEGYDEDEAAQEDKSRPISKAPPTEGDDNEALETDEAEAGEIESEGELYGEQVIIEYVHWKDFGHTWGRVWGEVKGRWRKVYLTRDELIERFGDKLGKLPPLDHDPSVKDNTADTDREQSSDSKSKKSTIYEFWTLDGRMAYWLHKDVPQFLDKQEDPLGLKEFFPCPRPLCATLANDTVIPTADYTEYQDQAREIDDYTARIASLSKAIKVVGVYDGSNAELQRILTEGMDNKMIAVDAWAAFAEKGGMKGTMDFLPLKEIVAALEALYSAREKSKAELYEVSGLSDILRGQGDPRETAKGVDTKSRFGTLRLTDAQAGVARFNRDAVRIIGEIISSHFELDTIKKISGLILLTAEQKQFIKQYVAQQQAFAASQQQPQPGAPGAAQGPGQMTPTMTAPPPGPGGMPMQPPPPPPADLVKFFKDPDKLEELMDAPTWEEVYALLKDDAERCFHIDIEIDSTIKLDQQAEQASRNEFLEAVSRFMQQALTVQDPALSPLLLRMLMFGVRGYHVGRELETAFEVTLKKMEKSAQSPQPKPNPDMEKIQAQSQADQQLEGIKHQNALQLQDGEMQHTRLLAQKDAEDEAARAAADQQIEAADDAHERVEHDTEAQREQTKLMVNSALEFRKQNIAAAKQSPSRAKAGAEAPGNPAPQASPADPRLDKMEQQVSAILQMMEKVATFIETTAKPNQGS